MLKNQLLMDQISQNPRGPKGLAINAYSSMISANDDDDSHYKHPLSTSQAKPPLNRGEIRTSKSMNRVGFPPQQRQRSYNVFQQGTNGVTKSQQLTTTKTGQQKRYNPQGPDQKDLQRQLVERKMAKDNKMRNSETFNDIPDDQGQTKNRRNFVTYTETIPIKNTHRLKSTEMLQDHYNTRTFLDKQKEDYYNVE